jgi:hypothetical protein
MSRLIRVGIGSRNYGYRRVTYGLPIEGVSYHKVPYIPWRYLRGKDPRLANTYWFGPLPDVHLLHLWNGTCLNRRPWITSFESHLPRYPGGEKVGDYGRDRMA